MHRTLTLSVHQLVDFLLRTGDIDSRVYNKASMLEGSRVHSYYQAKQGNGYISEYPLKTYEVVSDVELILQGRADGIIHQQDGSYIIDEIKSTVIDLKEFRDSQFAWHIGQAKCYGYMFCKEQKLDKIGIRLTYIRQGKEREKKIEEHQFTFYELQDFVLNLLEEYINFYTIVFRKLDMRRVSAKELTFPFPHFRAGQEKLIKLIYAMSQRRGKMFVEAPTGIGKTMSVLFPMVKSLSDDDKAKIFYLTAKGSGKEAAMHAIKLLKNKGLQLNEILITAKEKICMQKGKACNPDECPFAKGYYNKIQSVLTYSLLNYDSFDYETICEIALENQVCPFELQLDLSLFCDVIVCDYNYLFDPVSYMKRYFDEDASHFYALVDEAHNLVSRSRDMYSAEISLETIERAKKAIKHIDDKKLKRNINKLKTIFDETLTMENGQVVTENFNDEQYRIMNRFLTNYQDLAKERKDSYPKEVVDLYMEVNHFSKIADYYDERYISFYEITNDNTTMNLFCLDASRFLSNSMSSLKASILFSATMSPIEYYINTLGGDEANDPFIILPSPFEKENLLMLIAPRVSIKYKNRELSYGQVVNYIKSFIKGKVGNYFIYVPSYEYLNRLKDEFIYDKDEMDVFIQEKDMSEQEKEIFLSNFIENPTKTTLGFLVIGGTFSEGIDLVSDRLIGAVVIGVGLPKMNFKEDSISNYYKLNGMPGFNYAYLNPGMNKVMQAVGRVIRSENDRGAVLLIDERYMQKNYKDSFKREWTNYQIVFKPEEVEDKVINFFKK